MQITEEQKAAALDGLNKCQWIPTTWFTSEHLETIRAALTAQDVQGEVVEALKWEIKLIGMELDIINHRAKEDWLDKGPIVRSMFSRANRLGKALALLGKGGVS